MENIPKLRKKRPTQPLAREAIIRVALELVDREGLAALSMRRLGAVLNVDPMAVYHHLPNKEALLDALVEAVMSEMDLSRDNRRLPPEERIVIAATAYRDVMLLHVHALPLLLTRGPATPAALRPVELLIGILRDAGLSPAEALAGMNLIAAAVRGLVGMVAQAPEERRIKSEEATKALHAFRTEDFPYLLEAAPFAGFFRDQGFDFGVRSLAHGLLANRKRGPGRPRLYPV